MLFFRFLSFSFWCNLNVLTQVGGTFFNILAFTFFFKDSFFLSFRRSLSAFSFSSGDSSSLPPEIPHSLFFFFRRLLIAFSFPFVDPSLPFLFLPEIPLHLPWRFLIAFSFPFEDSISLFPFFKPFIFLFQFSFLRFFPSFNFFRTFLFIGFVFSFKCFMPLIFLYVSSSLFILCFKKQQSPGYFPFSSLPFAPFLLHFVSILPASESFYLLNQLRNDLWDIYTHHFRSDAISAPLHLLPVCKQW